MNEKRNPLNRDLFFNPQPDRNPMELTKEEWAELTARIRPAAEEAQAAFRDTARALKGVRTSMETRRAAKRLGFDTSA